MTDADPLAADTRTRREMPVCATLLVGARTHGRRCDLFSHEGVRGPISRTLCAGYNRSTFLTNPNQPDTSSAGFYQDAVTNH